MKAVAADRFHSPVRTRGHFRVDPHCKALIGGKKEEGGCCSGSVPENSLLFDLDIPFLSYSDRAKDEPLSSTKPGRPSRVLQTRTLSEPLSSNRVLAVSSLLCFAKCYKECSLSFRLCTNSLA